MTDLQRTPLRTLNNRNTHGSLFVVPPRDPATNRNRAECDAELVDFLVEKTLQSLMPLAVIFKRMPYKRAKKKRSTT
jgi:hypothetical protein